MIPEQDIDAVTALHDAYGLTAREARALALLARGGVVSSEEICSVYCDNPYAGPEDARHWLKRVRKKALGIDIRSHRGRGYALGPDSLKAVRQVIKKSHFGQNGLFYISIHPDHHINHSEVVSA